MWREAADHLLREAGVSVLFHTVVTGALLGWRPRLGCERVVKGRARSKCERSSRLMRAATLILFAMAGFESFIALVKMQ